MSFSFENVYNVMFEVTMVYTLVIHFITQLVIYYNTPRSMQIFARFLVNFFIWDSISHALWLGFHPYPMMPLTCFKLNGFLANYFSSEFVGHLFFMVSLATTVNVTVGIVISFQFRFIIIKYGKIVTKKQKQLTYAYCIAMHVLLTVGHILIYQTWPVALNDYPFPIDPETGKNLFCFKPTSMKQPFYIFCFLIFMTLSILGVTLFALLSFWEIHRPRALLSKKTAKLQKMFLISLICLSGIPINLGGIPLLVVCVHLYFHNLPYAQTIVAICIVIISNYGPVMCLTCLFLFRPYRNGILGIANRLFSTVHGIAVSVYSSSVVNAMVPSGT